MTEQIDDRLSSSMVCSSGSEHRSFGFCTPGNSMRGPLEYRSETLDLEMVNLHQAFASAPSVRVTGVQARRNSETLNPTNISIQLLDEEDGTFVLKITKGGKLGKVNMVEVKSRVDHKKIKEKIGGKRESKDIVSWIIRELEKENNEIRINIILTSKDTFNIILHGLIIALLLIDKNNHLYIKTSEKIEAMISKLGSKRKKTRRPILHRIDVD
ncbi:uncharacterized protein OCT59_018181 [Rhizophagus irregularis]|uniref:uncharacterized protein n=1 Tax=Rhizophagus irregularis TaxID=588596 RepID=UPI00332B4DF6|nr:hypothetical protein OCT59_018181 [Rhizophagus irregularis]